MKKTSNFTDNVVIICAVCVVVSFLSQVFKITPIVNIIYAFTLVLIFGCYFLSDKVSRIMVFLILLMGIASVANGFISSNSDYISHILILICTFICIEAGQSVKIEKKTFNIISYIFFGTGIILSAAYYVGPLRTSYFRWTDSICLNFPNPNVAGLWLCCIFIVIIYSAFLYTGFYKFSFFAVATSLIPILLKTNSRNSLLACLGFVICVMIVKVMNIKKVPNYVIAIIAILPLIVFFFYMFVIVKNIDFWETLFSIDDTDKGLGTRRSIWQGVLDNLWDCFWFGNYNKYYDSQMHNSLMTVFCRFGAFATGAVCVLLYKALKSLQENSSFYAVISLSAIFFTGCFEASLFIGIAGLYLMLLIIPACASVDTE